MREKNNLPLSAAVYGMDGRSQKMMVMFLQGPCKGNAVIVPDDEVADIDIIDADSNNSKAMIEERKENDPDRPLIVLSLQPLTIEGIIFVQKPVQTAHMIDALKEARLRILEIQKKSQMQERLNQPQANAISEQEQPSEPEVEMITRTHEPDDLAEKRPAEADDQPKKVFVNTDEQKKTSKHQTAMQLDEKSFSSFIGLASGVDFEDETQLKTASYNARQYYQGYVQSAYKLALAKKRVIQLNSGWKPLIIFPSTHEIWVDADDKQIRSFSSLPLNAGPENQGVTVAPYDVKNNRAPVDLSKFQTMDGFIWKLAIWTSKGRYPQSIDIDRPVYLKRWPNFTRLTISPHSLRIAALLMEGPRSLTNISQVLNIKPQYVFAFFSAAYATGLAGQAERKSDLIVAPEQPKANKKKGLLNKIMRKLRGTKS